MYVCLSIYLFICQTNFVSFSHYISMLVCLSYSYLSQELYLSFCVSDYNLTCLSFYLSFYLSIYIYLSVYLTITITRHGGEEGITCHLISFDSKSEQAGWASRLVTVTLAAARRVKKWATPVTYKVHYIHTGVYVFSVVLGRCFKSGWP